MNESYVVSPSADQEYLDFIGDQSLVVDPRAQGYGLSEFGFLDGYANKFFLLAGPNGTFVSPREIPGHLLDYYSDLGIPTASQPNIHTIDPGVHGALATNVLLTDPTATHLLTGRQGAYIVPYMATPDTEILAGRHGLQTLGSTASTDQLADKTGFQQALAAVAPNIERETGFDIAIPAIPCRAGDHSATRAAYAELSKGGSKDIVLVKPKSASALGIFVLRSSRGVAGLEEILSSQFADDEEVLIEAFVEHNHAPSMQGARVPSASYQQLYFGRQITVEQGERVEYEGSQIPFGPETVTVAPHDMQRLRAVHEALGDTILRDHNLSGIAGFDAVAHISPDGTIQTLKMTEVNLHLPSSLAVYTAVSKLFPDGFRGVAHNCNVPLLPGQTPADFMQASRDKLVSAKHTHGAFPLNASYTDKIDMIVLGKDALHTQQLLGELIS